MLSIKLAQALQAHVREFNFARIHPYIFRYCSMYFIYFYYLSNKFTLYLCFSYVYLERIMQIYRYKLYSFRYGFT